MTSSNNIHCGPLCRTDLDCNVYLFFVKSKETKMHQKRPGKPDLTKFGDDALLLSASYYVFFFFFFDHSQNFLRDFIKSC